MSLDTPPAVIEAAQIDPVASRQAVAIPLALIDANDRLREVSEAHAVMMADSMAGPHGLRQPIEVVRTGARYRLVFGAHRYRGAEINAWATIDAFIVEGSDAELRLREIDENLIRHELTALDRARFLLERKRLYEALNPEKRNGANQWTEGFANMANPRFTADIAEKTGLSERTIQRACELALKLSPDVVAQVRHTPLASNQAALETLAKHPHDRQLAAVKLILAEENPAKSVNEAFDRIDGKAVRPAAELWTVKFGDQWARRSIREKREFMVMFATLDLPGYDLVKVSK